MSNSAPRRGMTILEHGVQSEEIRTDFRIRIFYSNNFLAQGMVIQYIINSLSRIEP